MPGKIKKKEEKSQEARKVGKSFTYFNEGGRGFIHDPRSVKKIISIKHKTQPTKEQKHSRKKPKKNLSATILKSKQSNISRRISISAGKRKSVLSIKKVELSKEELEQKEYEEWEITVFNLLFTLQEERKVRDRNNLFDQLLGRQHNENIIRLDTFKKSDSNILQKNSDLWSISLPTISTKLNKSASVATLFY